MINKNKFKYLGLIIFLLFTGCASKKALIFNGSKGSNEQAYVEKIVSLNPEGFELWDPHEDIQLSFTNIYASSKLETLNVYTLANSNQKLPKLLEKYPKVGLFLPLNLLLYKEKEEEDNNTWVGYISPQLLLELSDITNSEDKQTLKSIYKPLDTNMKSVLSNTSVSKSIDYASIPKDTITLFEYDISGNVEDFMYEFQENFEAKLEYNNYTIAGYYNYKETFNDIQMAFNYDEYWVYNVVNLKSAYIISQNSPELFTLFPSRISMYIKNNKLYVSMIKYENWISILDLKDAQTIQVFKNYDKGIVDVLNELLE